METAPSFYKILTDMDILALLRIPEGFVEKYGVPREVKLINVLGATWEVRVEKVGDDSYSFTRGWAEFSGDMRLKIPDLLVFSYAGDATFDVSIYNDTMMDKVALAHENPRFNVTLKQYHYSKLHVPQRFAEDTGLTRKRNLRLQYYAGGPTGEVHLNTCNGRVAFGSGWTRFCKDNELTIDTCYTFEFIAMENVMRIQPHP